MLVCYERVIAEYYLAQNCQLSCIIRVNNRVQPQNLFNIYFVLSFSLSLRLVCVNVIRYLHHKEQWPFTTSASFPISNQNLLLIFLDHLKQKY
jgi:hypothetical protein